MPYELKAISHSGYNISKHEQINLGMIFNVQLDDIPYEHRTKEVSQTGVRAVCGNFIGLKDQSSETRTKKCTAALVFQPKVDGFIIENGFKASGEKKFRINPDIHLDELTNIANWEIVHNHRGGAKKGCRSTVDENDLCHVTRHQEHCSRPGRSRNSNDRPLQRKVRREVSILAERNPFQTSKQIYKEVTEKIPEFQDSQNRLIAGAAERHGITRRREKGTIKYIKNVVHGVPALGEISPLYQTITVDYPRNPGLEKKTLIMNNN